MKKIILAAAVLSMVSTMAFAGADITPKDTNSQGSAQGQGSSSYTANGDPIGGNGVQASDPTSGWHDQTNAPGSRPQAMQDAGVMNGNANGLNK